MAVEQHPDRVALAKSWQGRFNAADESIHKRLRDRWDSFDRDYHNYRDFSDSLNQASPRDRDMVLSDGRHAFGHQLFIPRTFATVEATLPRLLANPPHPVVLPARVSTDPDCAVNMGYLIADQQQRVDLQLTFQSVGKSALKGGLGIAKTRWQRDVRSVSRVVPSARGTGYALNEVNETVFDGPECDWVNPRDFLWDPLGYDMKTVRWVVHRMWRDTAYVLSRMRSPGQDDQGQEVPPPWSVLDRDGDPVPLTEEEIKAGSGATQYTETRRGGLLAQGFEGALDTSKLGDVHEVWECHDGVNVVVVLDRRWVVAYFPNGNARTRIPFHIFRPTEIEGSFHGKGVIEPIRDLQLELNDLRTDRQWNARMALHQFFFYDDNALDPDNAMIFPGAMIPTRGNPSEMIMQGQVKDIPGSGYQEESAIKADMDLTTGLADPIETGQSAPETATGVQLVQAATQHRINLMTVRCELELAKPVGRHWIEMNQREIMAAHDVRKPLAAPDPSEPDRLFEMVQLTPEDLQGQMDFDVEGNSMAADNVAQQRQDAQTLQALLGSPLFNAEPLAQEILRKMGYTNPQAYLAPQEPPLPPTFKAQIDDVLGPEASNALLAAARQGQQR